MGSGRGGGLTHDPGKLLAGEIGKPHGLRGEVYVIPISDDPRRFSSGSKVVHADGRELTIESSRTHRGRLLVKFEDIDGRTEAEGLKGVLFVGAEQSRALEASEYWHHEIVGCRVADPSGGQIGVVTDVTAGPAQDLLVVATPRGERLIPMVAEIVKSVDTAERSIVVEPPEGLLE